MDDNQLQTSFSVTVIFLNESDIKQELPDPHQELTLQVHRQLDDVSLSIKDGKQKQELAYFSLHVEDFFVQSY